MADKTYQLTFEMSNGIQKSVTFTVPQGPQGIQGEKGDPGATGADGYTPVKGVDYFTADDKAEMVAGILAQLPSYDGTVEVV